MKWREVVNGHRSWRTFLSGGANTKTKTHRSERIKRKIQREDSKSEGRRRRRRRTGYSDPQRIPRWELVLEQKRPCKELVDDTGFGKRFMTQLRKGTGVTRTSGPIPTERLEVQSNEGAEGEGCGKEVFQVCESVLYPTGNTVHDRSAGEVTHRGCVCYDWNPYGFRVRDASSRRTQSNRLNRRETPSLLVSLWVFIFNRGEVTPPWTVKGTSRSQRTTSTTSTLLDVKLRSRHRLRESRRGHGATGRKGEGIRTPERRETDVTEVDKAEGPPEDVWAVPGHTYKGDEPTGGTETPQPQGIPPAHVQTKKLRNRFRRTSLPETGKPPP